MLPETPIEHDYAVPITLIGVRLSVGYGVHALQISSRSAAVSRSHSVLNCGGAELTIGYRPNATASDD